MGYSVHTNKKEILFRMTSINIYKNIGENPQCFIHFIMGNDLFTELN